MSLQKLFTPIKIGNTQLRNRIVMAPMATNFLDYGEVNQRLVSFYRERAKGEPGLIVISMTPNRLDNDPPFPGIYDDRFIHGISKLSKTCHQYGTKIFAQLVLTYSWAFPGRPVELVSPSGVTITKRVDPPFRLGGPPQGSSKERRPLKDFEIEEIIEAVGDASKRVREAGFDGVQFLGATGYLISQFISPITNTRTDAYGGDLDKRLRFLTEMIGNCRKKAGEDWTYLVRVSLQNTDNGVSIDDLKEIAVLLERSGVNALDAMPGWHEDPVPMIAPATPQGNWAHIAQELKKSVKIPVGAGTQIQDPEVADRILREGKADYVYMCRALIAEPNLPTMAREGRMDEIRPCITCSRCLESVADNQSVYCTVNPAVGREEEYVVERTEKAKKVFVIGGGPAGIEAALTAASRGHVVTLFERTHRLGGQLNPGSVPPHKERIALFRDYLVRRVNRSVVDIRLNTECTVETVEEGKPDLVIVANGANPIVPNLPGAELGHVVTALDVLNGAVETGGDVAIIGGGAVGCELAEFLAERGKTVTILEMLDAPAKDVSKIDRWHLLFRLKKAGVRIEVGVRVVRITQDGVEGVRQGGSEHFSADSVVFATGMRGDRTFAGILREKAPKVYYIGDCSEPRKIAQVQAEGFLAGARA